MQITLRFDEELAIMVKQRKPKRQALAPFCLDLIEQALTGQLTYAPTVSVRETNHSPVNAPEQVVAGMAVPAVETAVPLETSFSTERNSTVLKKRKKTVCTEDFEAFWKLYQSCPMKAGTQRKTKAWEEWRKAIKIETPERLTEALENVLEAQRKAKADDGWAAPLPDCFRWLRDGCYTAALETHEVANPLLIKYNTDPEYRAWCERELASDPNFVLPHLRKK